jgi:non-specific serine/threonine protein kinase
MQQSKLNILQGMMKLRQICNSPELIADTTFNCSDSAKLDLLMEKLVPLVKTNKVLVFSQFTSMLALIQSRLENENIVFSYLDGKTNQRIELVDEFNGSETNRVFLISLKAGGTGLNLTSADYVFLVDPWWNPATEAQAIDRTHRIGQKNHVFAYKMVCSNSIEEKIIQLQEKKKLLSEDLIQAQENFVKKLSRADVEVLFS